jgi:hypothetical protein
MSDIDPVDYLKYAAAEGKTLIEMISNELCRDLVADDEVDRICDMLFAVRKLLHDAIAGFCGSREDMNTYTDGRKVETFVELEFGNHFTYCWHPDPAHRDNRPRTVLDHVECTSGAKHSVIIAADQVLDVVHHHAGLRLVQQVDTAGDGDDG